MDSFVRSHVASVCVHQPSAVTVHFNWQGEISYSAWMDINHFDIPVISQPAPYDQIVTDGL